MIILEDRNKILEFLKKFLKFGFIIYCIIIILGKLNIISGDYIRNRDHIIRDIQFGFYNLNTKPFFTISEYIKFDDYRVILINILAFIPFGLVYNLILFKYINFYKYTLYIFSFIIFLEIAQFITKFGFCDIDIIILDLLGVLIGYIISYIIRFFICKLVKY